MLPNHKFKRFYSTAQDDIPESFYNEALQESVKYDRVSGYFSAASLAYYSRGIESLYQNGGKYRLIISNEISEDDYNEIVKGYQLKDKLCNQLLEKINPSQLDFEQQRNFVNLAYLISIGLVEIKIGFTYNGIFHAKYGYFQDKEGNVVYFSGSMNETEAGFIRNYEDITVLKSWEETDNSLSERVNDFEMLWDGQSNDGMIFIKSVDEVINSNLITFSKDRLILDKMILEDNALVLYYDDGLFLQNNTGNPIDVTQRSIKKVVRYTDYDNLANNPCGFSKNLTYSDINEVIKCFNRYEKRTGTKLVVADSVNEFIEATKFEINEIAKRGNTIKQQDSMYQQSLNEFKKIVNREVSRPLYEIQDWVSFYQANMKRVANFSVPGAGKTSMIYGTFAYLSSPEVNKVDKIVMIGPKNSFISWKEEFKAIFKNKRTLSVLDIHEPGFDKSMFYKNVDSYNLFLVNYESLDTYYNELKNIINSKTMIVFDEVHKIKNVNSKRAKLSIELAKKTNYRYVLTGTPIPNSYLDIWNFLHILYNAEFNDYFGLQLGELDKPSIVQEEEINEKLAPFFWRITKDELAVPPANPDRLLKVKANSTEQKIINLMWKKWGHSPFKLYIRLIQLASNPSLLNKKISQNMFGDYGDGITNLNDLMDDDPGFSIEDKKLINSLPYSSKYIACVQKAANLMDAGKKIVIWCIFIDTINKLAAELDKQGYRVAVIYGQIDAKEREKIILDYQQGKYDVLITNPHTLAESVSLHKVAHDALYLEYSFNLTHMLQSRDRIHRLGLKENQETNYYYFMLEGNEGERSTIDNKIYHRLSEKRDTMYKAIENNQLSVEYNFDEKQEILSMMEEELNK